MSPSVPTSAPSTIDGIVPKDLELATCPALFRRLEGEASFRFRGGSRLRFDLPAQASLMCPQ